MFHPEFGQHDLDSDVASACEDAGYDDGIDDYERGVHAPLSRRPSFSEEDDEVLRAQMAYFYNFGYEMGNPGPNTQVFPIMIGDDGETVQTVPVHILRQAQGHA